MALTEVKRVDVKEAVQSAKRFASEVFEPEELSGLGLEGIERSPDRKYWLVTLGFTRPSLYPKRLSPSTIVINRELPREYKTFKVDARSGEVVGFKLFEA